jgi:hypothetical protein
MTPFNGLDMNIDNLACLLVPDVAHGPFPRTAGSGWAGDYWNA